MPSTELKASGACLTHKNNDPKTSVLFNVNGYSSVSAIVVFQSPVGTHEYAMASTAIVDPGKKIYVVGAGPGGLAAARYASELASDVVVYERGPAVAAAMYTAPIVTTAYGGGGFLYPNLLYAPLNNNDPKLAGGVGGTQNVNGAVYKPGTAVDLAKSVGVSVGAASTAIDVAGSYIEHTEYDMMWSCIDKPNCDATSLAVCNSKMARRSLGYEHGLDTIQVNTRVVSVSSTEIKFESGHTITLGPNDAVIVAAGALTSPALLGNTTFTGWNHYHHVSQESYKSLTTSEMFEYNATHEINRASCTLNPTNPINLKIEMLMTHDIRETHTVGKAYTLPAAVPAGYAQSWHFAGTVNHTQLKVQDKVYIGDASALKTPFNCHTSMPAAAAGVLAAQRALGIKLVLTPTDRKFSVDFAWLFVIGSAILGIGVIAHTFKATRSLHYGLMPIGGGLVIAAGFVANANQKGLQPSYHARFGWAIIALIMANAVLGVAARQISSLGMVHRGVGAATCIALLVMLITVLMSKSRVESWETGSELYSGTAASTAVVAVAICRVVAVNVAPSSLVGGLQTPIL